MTCLLISLVERHLVTFTPACGGCASNIVNLVPRKFDLYHRKCNLHLRKQDKQEPVLSCQLNIPQFSNIGATPF